jgi:ribosome maturation factor RimP
LEVTSPGLERRLRTPEHFRRALGAEVAVRTHAGAPGERRARGILVAATDDGVTVRTDDGGERHLAYDDVERARTVFEWAPAARASKAGPQRKARAS